MVGDLFFPEGEPVLGAAAFSPDDRLLAVVGNLNSVHLFDLNTFESLAVLRASSAIRLRALAFSPDNSKLAAVGTEGRVAIWNLKTIHLRLAQLDLDWSH
jgi:WD40 repeat protein